MTTTWWGITILCAVCAVVWILLSAILYRRFFKRFYDIVLSLLAVIVFSPLLLILTVIGAVAMKGNPFFVQRRPGRRKKLSKRECRKRNVPYGTYGEEKIIRLLKFRTMTNAKDADGNLLPDEKRLNKYGKFLRSTSLDEIPSILNIATGGIAIVGPRPLLVKYLPLYSEEQRHRHDVRPGLTGLAQVNGRNAISWDEKFKYDLDYVKKITLWRDLAILFRTVGKVFKRSGINQEGQATMVAFTGTEGEKNLQKSLYIVGAGGCGREVYSILQAQQFSGYKFSGFLDDNSDALKDWKGNGRVVGSVADEVPSSDKVYVVAIGDTAVKKKVVQILQSKCAEFVSAIHPTAVINETATIGKSVILYPYTIVSDSVRIGDFVLLNIATSVGHDAVVEDFCTISAHCDLTGYARVGKESFLSSSVVAVPHSHIGENVFVAAGSVVIGKISDGLRVSGNPAMKMRNWG